MSASSTPLLVLRNLHLNVEGTPILKGVNLTIQSGEVHAIMGPNGAGKSTLGKFLAGHPSYEKTSGEVWFKGEDLSSMEPEERAHAGLFLGFQYPIEIPGVSNTLFLKTALNSKRKAQGLSELAQEEWERFLSDSMEQMEMRSEFRERNVNENFSGGEKKRNEILQMAVLKPDLAILDETDSGLDIDAMKVVSQGVNRILKNGMGLLLITHYQRLLNYIRPHHVHVLMEGKIIRSGGPSLALELEEKGYDWLIESEVGRCPN